MTETGDETTTASTTSDTQQPEGAVEQTGDEPQSVGERLEAAGTARSPLTVRLSRELITLLSEQLYTSASKAIEELVVNSFDADADNCWVVVPSASPGTDTERLEVIAVLDDGTGMDEDGLADLWRVGASHKREEVVAKTRKRRQIGKFGIGKLATYALASRITYVTSAGDGAILTVTLSFDAFQSEATGEPDEPVTLEVREVTTEQLAEQAAIAGLCEASGLTVEETLSAQESWTLVLLEDFKPRAAKLSTKRLRWVLSTAMPLAGFTLHLNGEVVESSKAIADPLVSFAITDLPQARLARLEAKTSQAWAVEEVEVGKGAMASALVCSTLPSGVRGDVIVTEKTIYGGKSSDLTRSHGFFVHVRGRLISEDDPLFGVQPLSYEVFNRFRSDLQVDDLDADLTAPREGAGTGDRVSVLQDLLIETFNEARARYDVAERAKFKQETKKEHVRHYVYPRFVEKPLADALLRNDRADDGTTPGTDADDKWFYLQTPEAEKIPDIAAQLYSITSREPYTFRFEEFGRDGRLVEFDPDARSFVVNADHELSLAFKDNPASRDLLYDVSVAEALLEIYLRESGMPAHLIGEVLERRDGLLRSLAREQVNSPAAIAALLQDAVAKDRDLEIALVIAARSLGFVAKQIGNADRADGLARFSDYPNGERKITLEAKSSQDVPSLGALDFAGLAQHMIDEGADGCLLLAPSYPGGTRGEDAQAAKRADTSRVSCWTIDQLARVVSSLESRDITARNVLDVVLNRFAPEDVASAIDELLANPENAPRALAVAMLATLRSLEDFAPADATRSLDMVLVELGRAGLKPTQQEAKTALRQLVGASGGALTIVSENRILLNTSLEELERRTASWAANGSSTRHGSTFHEDPEHRDVRPTIDDDA